MNGRKVMQAVARIERLYEQLAEEVRAIVHTLDLSDQRLVGKITKGLVALDRAYTATTVPAPGESPRRKARRKTRRPRRSTAAVKAVRRSKRPAVRRPKAEIEAAIVRAATLPCTAAVLRTTLGYRSASGMYAVLGRMVKAGVLTVRGEDAASGAKLYEAVEGGRKTNGADTSTEQLTA